MGYTQAELAKAIGVSEKTIFRWENEIREPRSSEIKKLSQTLEIQEEKLLNGPTKNELTIEFLWEVKSMDVANIESNHFNYGFRGHDILLWGALADDENDESAVQLILKHVKAARAGKRATEKEFEKLEHS
jgi:transcriptional regulator with XRE-family HTH domain